MKTKLLLSLVLVCSVPAYAANGVCKDNNTGKFYQVYDSGNKDAYTVKVKQGDKLIARGVMPITGSGYPVYEVKEAATVNGDKPDHMTTNVISMNRHSVLWQLELSIGNHSLVYATCAGVDTYSPE